MTIPNIIEDIHAEYLDCGASVVTTNTYASNKHCLHADGVGERTAEANEIGVAIAKRACANARGGGGAPTFVLGSISTHPPNFKAAVQAAEAAEAAGDQVEGEKDHLRNIDVTALSTWSVSRWYLGVHPCETKSARARACVCVCALGY